MSEKTLFIVIDGEFKELLDKAANARKLLLEALDMEPSDYEALTDQPHAMMYQAIKNATANVETNLAHLGLFVLIAMDKTDKQDG